MIQTSSSNNNGVPSMILCEAADRILEECRGEANPAQDTRFSAHERMEALNFLVRLGFIGRGSFVAGDEQEKGAGNGT